MEYYSYFGFLKDSPEDFCPEEIWSFEKAMCTHASPTESNGLYILIYLDCLTQKKPAINHDMASDEHREDLLLRFAFELVFGQLLT